MLEERGVRYRYREYTKEPLTRAELKRILKLLGLTPADILRKKDAANKELGRGRMTGAEVEIDGGRYTSVFYQLEKFIQSKVPGMTFVAPFSSVKSVSAQIVLNCGSTCLRWVPQAQRSRWMGCAV